MEISNYFKVRMSTILPDVPITFDLYISIAQNMTLYLRAGESISLEKAQNLEKKDSMGVFFVSNADRNNYQTYVKGHMLSAKYDPLQKAKLLRDSSIVLIEELFEHPDVNKALDQSRPIIKDFMQFMESEPEAMANLIGLSSHDFYTYNHSLDVGIYALGLAQALGFNKADLEELGIGALFHDLGKRNVSLDILCKKGGLNESEWAQMQKHPQYGLIILESYPGVTEGLKAACFEHHESFSGNGYPQQLMGEEIHPFARIVAITDTYDAMTTQRSYNTPLAPIDAINMIKEKLTGRYDPEMVKALHSVLFKLPSAS